MNFQGAYITRSQLHLPLWTDLGSKLKLESIVAVQTTRKPSDRRISLLLEQTPIPLKKTALTCLHLFIDTEKVIVPSNDFPVQPPRCSVKVPKYIFQNTSYINLNESDGRFKTEDNEKTILQWGLQLWDCRLLNYYQTRIWSQCQPFD